MILLRRQDGALSTDDFKKAWDNLSQIQQEAANWIDGPLLVLAGPGSGKTKVPHNKNIAFIGFLKVK